MAEKAYHLTASAHLHSDSCNKAQADGQREQFIGYERDNETELDYVQARYYGSKQGRFSSVDSFQGSSNNPQSLNLYAYVQGNPLKFTDPTGHKPEDGNMWVPSSMSDWETLHRLQRYELFGIAPPKAQIENVGSDEGEQQTTQQQLQQIDNPEPDGLILCDPNFDENGPFILPRVNFREGTVNYHGHTVSDPDLQRFLGYVSLHFDSTVHVTSGNRNRVVNGNVTSLHLSNRAVDFYVQGVSLRNAYNELKQSYLVPTTGYEFIYHTEATVAPHLHIGHRLPVHVSSPTNYIIDTGQILPRRRRR